MGAATGNTAPAFSPVTWERLLNAADEPENWLMYSGTPMNLPCCV